MYIVIQIKTLKNHKYPSVEDWLNFSNPTIGYYTAIKISTQRKPPYVGRAERNVL